MAQQDDQLETGLLVAEAEHVIAERRAGGSYASNLSDLDEGASSLGSVFTLCNSAIGAGVLSLPYAFKCAGAVGCFILCAVLGLTEGLTLYVLSKFAERYDAVTYSLLVRRALGRKLSAVLSAVLVVYQLGSCAAYLIIVGDSFVPLIEQVAPAGSLLANRGAIITFFALAVILPLCLPRNLSELTLVSTCGVCGFIYVAISIVYEGSNIVMTRKEGIFDGVELFKWDFGALFAIPIIVFGFNCHANVVTIFYELDLSPKVLVAGLPDEPSAYQREGRRLGPKPRTRKMIGMISVILAAIALIMIGYLAVGFAGYLAFPRTVSSNVLKTFPDTAIMQVARGVIGVVVIGHFPLNHNPARQGLESLENYLLGWKHISFGLSCLQAVVFVSTSLAIALAVSDLGSVLHMIGGTAASFIIFFLPGLMLVNAAIVKSHASGMVASNSELSLQGHPDETGARAEPPPGQPLLASPSEVGIKRVGIIYSPRTSWWLGIILMALAAGIFVLTIATAIWHP